MAKKAAASIEAPASKEAAPTRQNRVRLSKSLRLHIRRLKAEGRVDEAEGLAKAEYERKTKENQA